MRLKWHIFALVVGIVMAIPKVVNWLGLPHAQHGVRQVYAQPAHSDFVVVVGGKGFDLETILAGLALVGVVLVTFGVWGICGTESET